MTNPTIQIWRVNGKLINSEYTLIILGYLLIYKSIVNILSKTAILGYQFVNIKLVLSEGNIWCKGS